MLKCENYLTAKFCFELPSWTLWRESEKSKLFCMLNMYVQQQHNFNEARELDKMKILDGNVKMKWRN